MKTFHQLQEGVYDPNIFKAIFMAGGPGSGKSYVARRTTGGMGMKMVNSDDIYEKMLNDAGLDTTPEDIYSDQGQEIRGRAKGVTKRMQGNFLEGRLGLIIDGTGKDYDKIAKQVQGLRALGYETYMIFVNTLLQCGMQCKITLVNSRDYSVVRTSSLSIITWLVKTYLKRSGNGVCY